MPIELRAGPTRLEVLPEYGGRIHQLWLTIDGREEPVLWSPDDVVAYETAPLYGGCFPMAPWPNRIADGRFPWAGREVSVPQNDPPNALHGLVFDRPWGVVARAGRVVELRCEFDERWPWAGYAWQRIELGEAGLTIKIEARSGRETFPAGVGLHPWFRRGVAGAREVRVTVPAARHYELADQLPTGKMVAPAGDFDLREGAILGDRRLDDCYAVLEGPAVIDWGRVRLALETESAEPHLMVHTPEQAVCIESQTCAPNAFNLRTTGLEGTGFAIAEPGRAVALVNRWKWQIL